MYLEGIVKWYSNEKGYGFVSIDEGRDAFLHYSELEKIGIKQINEGNELQYDLVETGRGYKAENISLKESSIN